MRKTENLAGKVFGRLTVVERVYRESKATYWLCTCECGGTKEVTAGHLKSGNVRSCGCLSKDVAVERGLKSKIGERTRKHGGFGTRLYGIWAAMKRRCFNSNTRYYADYGGRGITVCDEWSKDYSAFKEWAEDNGYAPGLSIDRIDVDGDYKPDNCRWIPLSEQNSNKRVSIKIEHNGKQYSIRELSELTGLKVRTIQARYYRGLPVESILNNTLKKNQFD